MDILNYPSFCFCSFLGPYKSTLSDERTELGFWIPE